mmetsp:Transcript_21350/g.46663  ORF Transcript_21350/g.46663 Transcript_21350/m.46663 type:complete len:219 (+) Transcript_21350:989-1645(+)
MWLRACHVLQHAPDGGAAVGDVLLKVALALLLLTRGLGTCDFGLELEAARLYRLLDRAHHLLHVVPDVLLARPLEGDLGAHDAHKHAHLVAALVDFVRGPGNALECGLGDDVRAALKQERDAVGEAVHVDAGLDVTAAQAHRRLHDEGVTLKHAHVTLIRCNELWPQLFHDPQPQVVLPGRAQVLAARVVKARLVQQLVQAHHLCAVEVLRAGCHIHP